MPNEVSANQVSAIQVLANEVLAPLPAVTLSEPDYRAFCAALETSARGRAFLAEYARRNRHADTETVLAALDRLEALVARQSATTEADRIRQELRALLAALRGAQPVIDASAAAIKAAKLAALIGFVQHRIESIVAPMHEQSPLPPEVAALILLDAPAAEAVRAHLTVVPPAEQPELPIPAPAAAPPPAIALVHDPEKHVLDTDRGWEPVLGQDQAQTKHVQVMPYAPPPVQDDTPPAPEIIQRSAAIIPEVNLFDGAPAQPAAVDVAPPEQIPFAPTPTPLIPAQAGIQESNQRSKESSPGSPLARGRAEDATPADPLAHIMALSDEERIALFS